MLEADENKTMRKAAAYIRVSTSIQAREGESLEIQEDKVMRHIEYHKYELTEIYREEGVSGSKMNRPALTRLRNDARNKKFEAVVFVKLSRFGRNTRDLLQLYEEFQNEYNVQLISIDEPFTSDNKLGKLMINILSAISEFERDTIEGQMREGKLNKLRKNEIFLGRTPFGYRFNKETKKMEVSEEEKRIYLDIVRMYLVDNLSLNEIALKLNRDGIM